MNEIRITPEVNSTSKIAYLIRRCDVVGNQTEEVNLVERESDARLAIDSFAAALIKEITNEWTKVYREDENDRKIILSTQSIGYIMNGSITPTFIIDYIPLGYVSVSRGRFEKESIIPSPPPLPPFEAIPRRVAVDYEVEISDDDSDNISDDGSNSEYESDDY